jgi:hypothetical protein
MGRVGRELRTDEHGTKNVKGANPVLRKYLFAARFTLFPFLVPCSSVRHPDVVQTFAAVIFI